MKINKAANIIRWIARVYSGVVILFFLVMLFGYITGKEDFNTDWRNYVLHFSLIVGLLIAYKRELTGGVIATIGILISGFIHPLVLGPGLLYILFWVINKKTTH